MKTLYFMKIDYIRSRSQMYLIFGIMALVTLIMKYMTDGTDEMVFMYGVFIAIVFSTVPFGNCSRSDAGFLQMLPATTWQRVLGRFLFGLTLILTGSVISVGCTVVYQLLMGTGINLMAPPFYMIFASIGMVIITVQYMILYLIGENRGAQYLSLIRMIPGMSFFFGSIKLMGAVQEDSSEVMKVLELINGRINVIGWGSVIIALAVMAVGVILCVRATEKRDY